MKVDRICHRESDAQQLEQKNTQREVISWTSHKKQHTRDNRNNETANSDRNEHMSKLYECYTPPKADVF
ncbi:hypothetical protein JCM19236_2208 [Vibrio sp. JCM 19236]|nr:hypothetical protein JCM19236_2208 [Vibrio sp. JCM 19236]